MTKPSKPKTATTRKKRKEKCPLCNESFLELAPHIRQRHADVIPNRQTKRGNTTPEDSIVNFLHIDPMRTKKPYELSLCVDWYSTPSFHRNPKTQKDFAKQIGVSEDTIINWTKIPYFWDEVASRQKSYFKAKSSDVLHGLHLSAKAGNSENIKTFLKYIMGWVDKIETANTHTIDDNRREEIENRVKTWQKVTTKVKAKND